MHLVTLIPASQVAAAQAAEPNVEISPQSGAPFGMRRQVMLSSAGLPCNPPPWGQLHAIDMRTGRVLWEVPIGTTGDLVPGSQLFLKGTGVPNFGGPLATASGLVFLGATLDDYLRAFDGATARNFGAGACRRAAGDADDLRLERAASTSSSPPAATTSRGPSAATGWSRSP